MVPIELILFFIYFVIAGGFFGFLTAHDIYEWHDMRTGDYELKGSTALLITLTSIFWFLYLGIVIYYLIKDK